MEDKYEILDNNREIKQKPIDEVLNLCKSLVEDVQTMKKDIYHMKAYIRKLEVRESVKPKTQTEIATEKGWFF